MPLSLAVVVHPVKEETLTLAQTAQTLHSTVRQLLAVGMVVLLPQTLGLVLAEEILAVLVAGGLGPTLA
jgi:hypothetical protein